jgi:hypothetical protein
VFKVGDQVLLRAKEQLNTADMGKRRPWWDSDDPFTVTACPSSKACTLAQPSRRMRSSLTVNVDPARPTQA